MREGYKKKRREKDMRVKCQREIKTNKERDTEKLVEKNSGERNTTKNKKERLEITKKIKVIWRKRKARK